MTEDEDKKVNTFFRQLYPISGIILYTITTGCIIGYPGVLLPQLREPNSFVKVTDESSSWIASVVGFGMLTGTIAVPFIMENFSRKMTNILAVLPSLAGWAFVLIAGNVPLLILARYLQGIAMGIQGSMSAITIGEYSSPKYRGPFLGTVGFSISFGVFICHLCGSFMTWKNTALVSMSFATVSLVIMVTSPESPYWLASQKRYEECIKAFTWLRGNNKSSREELDNMILKESRLKAKSRNEKLQILSCNTISIFKKREFYKPSGIIFVLFVLMQFSGANVLPNYCVVIMKDISQNTVDPHYAMIAIDLARFSAAGINIFTMKRLNARTVLFFSSLSTISAILLTATYLVLRDFGIITITHNWIPTSFVLLYAFCIAMGVYPLPFSLLGELYPMHYKSLGAMTSGLIIGINYFAAIKTFPFLFSHLQLYGALFFYASVTSASILILYFILPETRGRTLQEIEDYFRGKPTLDAKEEEMKALKSATEITPA